MRYLLAVLIACTTLPSLAQKMEVHVMPVDSMEGFMQWMQQKPTPTGTYQRAQQLVVGKKVYAPIIVNGLDPAASGPIDLVGDLEVVGPDGKVLPMKKCCRFSAANRAGLHFAVLSNAPMLEMDATDPKGMYTLRATVNDGKQTLSGTDQVAFGTATKAAAKPAKESKAADTSLASEPASGKTFPHGDVTRCLDLATPREVIRCSEGK